MIAAILGRAAVRIATCPHSAIETAIDFDLLDEHRASFWNAWDAIARLTPDGDVMWFEATRPRDEFVALLARAAVRSAREGK